HRFEGFARLLAGARVAGGGVAERHGAYVDGVPQAVIIANHEAIAFRRIAGGVQVDLADEAAPDVAVLCDAIEMGGFLRQRHWPFVDAGDAAVGVEPGPALVAGPDRADVIARQPAFAPEVAELAVAESPRPLRRAGPEVTVGHQVQAG